MPNILILGGSGYLGSALSRALVASGHYCVFVQTRSKNKEDALLVSEVTPIVLALDAAEDLRKALVEHEIHVVVDVSQGYREAALILSTILAVAKQRREALTAVGAQGPKLGFVYTSGTMVHGSSNQIVSNLSPVGSDLALAKPASMVSWRPAHEQAILAARGDVNVAILRPGVLYGRSAWNFGPWWGPVEEIKDNVVTIKADKSARAGLVHVDDAAAGFHAVIDRIDGQLGSWPVFDLVTETVPVTSIIHETLRALNLDSTVTFVGPGDDLFHQGLNLCTKIDASRACSLISWQPKRRDFLINIKSFYLAWKAYHKCCLCAEAIHVCS